MKRTLSASTHTWILREPFVISRGVMTSVEVIVVRIGSAGLVGRGEGRGVPYHGETPESMLAQIEKARRAIEAGASRTDLLALLPPGGARNAVDSAMWDLEARQAACPAWKLAGLQELRPVVSAVTIGIRSQEAYEVRARELSKCPWLKVKVADDDALESIAAVHRAAPRAQLIVDPNQAWSARQLMEYAPRLAGLGVALLEQPVAASEDDALRDFSSPVPICADEAFDTVDDLPRIRARYDFVNIKLDKTGGLTAALQLARAAAAEGLRLMVGCMTGSSLAMAPALVLAQLCEVVDLDGPLLLGGDWADGLTYQDGHVSFPSASLWGGAEGSPTELHL